MKPALPSRFFQTFVELTAGEIGWDVIRLVLDRAGVPSDHFTPETSANLNPESAAEAYAHIQQAMRVYYGRGARGVLVRVGRKLWDRFLREISWIEKIQMGLIHILPLPMRYKFALDFGMRYMRTTSDSITIHTLDLDFMVADHLCAAATGQHSGDPLCYVTLGFIEEILLWADGREHDIFEESCRAKGSDACEFRIKVTR